MQVDIGTCALCGAKNSKFVETCYKCGAPLPWAPNYVAANPPKPNAQPAAPKPAPAQTSRPPATPRPPAPAPVAPSAGAPRPGGPNAFDQNAFDQGGADNAFLTAVQKPVQMPAWAAASGALGFFILGMLMTKAFSRAPEPAVVVVPTAIPITTATPLAAAPALVPTTAPAATMAPTVAPTATPIPSLTPAVSGTAVPGSAAPVAPAAPVPPNLAFDNVYNSTHQGTADQQRAFWSTAVNGKVNWRGTVVTAPASGPVTVHCGTGKDVVNVIVNLDPASGQIQGGLKTDQVVSVEGELQSYSPDTFVLSRGAVRP